MRVTGQPVLASLIGIIAVLHAIGQARLYTFMRARHEPTWKALGSPTIWNVGMGRPFSYFRFVWRGGHRCLQAHYADRLLLILRSLDVAFAAVLLFSALLVIM